MAMISVIVPVYKTEKYVGRCIDSILRQTYDDFELILVDDGSPDSSGSICDAYAEKDDRIHVIHQKNGGAARARNCGIEWALANSDSQWLHFIDSDDWIHPQMLERLIHAAEEKGTDVSACFYLETDGRVEPDCGHSAQINLWTPERLFMEHNVLVISPCVKLYRKHLFEDIRFPENRYAEDEFTTYKVVFACKEVAVVESHMYYYFYNDDGLSKIKWHPKRLDGLDALEEQMAYFKANGYNQAHDMIAIAYADHLLNHQRLVEKTDLPADKKKYYQKMLKKRLHKALRQYGSLYVCQHRGIYVELYPQLTATYRFLKQRIKYFTK